MFAHLEKIKKSGQPAYHFWEFFIKPNRKPIELKDFFY
ncbi:DUF5083 family protein [Staphylococcus aureus]|nr:DUF5083 family protein [Staphylococcus aureus]